VELSEGLGGGRLKFSPTSSFPGMGMSWFSSMTSERFAKGWSALTKCASKFCG
jgi:hypothetical protein